MVCWSQVALVHQSRLGTHFANSALTNVTSEAEVHHGGSIYTRILADATNQGFALSESWLLNIYQGTTGLDHLMKGFKDFKYLDFRLDKGETRN